jgi:outer membrane protein TolC
MHELIFSLAISALMIIPSSSIFPQSLDDTAADLDSLIHEARRNNPEIQAAGHQSEAAWSRVRQAVSWDPPQVGVEFYQTPAASFPNPFKNQMEYDYFIEQMIPFPGKLSAMGRAARNGAGMAEEDAKAVERRVIRELKSAYAELYLIQRKIEINLENRGLMQQLVETASRQYETGMGTQTDFLRARTELSKLVNDGTTLRRDKRSAEAMINTIINRPLRREIGRIDTLIIQIPGWTREQFDSLALTNRHELRAMRFQVAMNESEVLAAQWEYAPDFTARFMYKDMAMTPKDYWSFMVGVSLPITPWSSSKTAGRVDETRALKKQSEASLVQMKNMVLLDVQNAWSALQANLDLIDLNRKTVLPQSQMTLESAIASYRTGKIVFATVIDAWRMSLMAELDNHMAVMNAAVGLADLEAAVGVEF